MAKNIINYDQTDKMHSIRRLSQNRSRKLVHSLFHNKNRFSHNDKKVPRIIRYKIEAITIATVLTHWVFHLEKDWLKNPYKTYLEKKKRHSYWNAIENSFK